jgi:3-oxoacyl-[acyl-carrier protein] reductase
MQFRGQVAIITGAASGIGLAVTKSLLLQSATVIVIDLKEDSLEKEFSKYDDQVLIVGLDITNESEVKRKIQEIGVRFKRIDILINCAGMTGITNVYTHQVDTTDLRKVFDLNFMASLYTSQAVLPFMIEQRYGRILHISSIAGKEGNAGMLAYSASKAAIIGMTKVQGKEYCEKGITVNALAPAVIRTPLVDAMPAEQVKYMTDKIPMRRCGTLDEAVSLINYIVSRDNSFTTGFTFDLSGGRATY